jgi:SAM-dependent methyltransferase
MDVRDHSLAELRDLTESTLLVAAAHEVGLFASLGKEPADAGALAERLDLDGRATHIVCEALVELGLLTVDDDAYRPTPRCREELCEPDGPGYVAGGLPHWLRSMRAWTHLDEVLRRGGPLEERPSTREEPRVARFMSAMAAAPEERVARIVALCLGRRPGAASVLDLGAGPGHISRAFAERGVAATMLDMDDVVRHVTATYGLEDVDDLTVLRGDFNTDPLPRGPFDIVLLSNVLHIYPPERNVALLRKVADVTASGSLVAVAEFLRGRSGRAGRFGVQMLLHTDGGDAYGEDQVAEWLEEAGFGEVRVDDLDPDRQLLTALRL